jgi:hypothetical protein
LQIIGAEGAIQARLSDKHHPEGLPPGWTRRQRINLLNQQRIEPMGVIKNEDRARPERRQRLDESLPDGSQGAVIETDILAASGEHTDAFRKIGQHSVDIERRGLNQIRKRAWTSIHTDELAQHRFPSAWSTGDDDELMAVLEIVGHSRSNRGKGAVPRFSLRLSQ